MAKSMGSEITLSIGSLVVHWCKNHIGVDHSSLFVAADRKKAKYFYGDQKFQRKPAFARPLRSIVDRLDLLGYTVAECKELYEKAAAAWHDDGEPAAVSFATFARALGEVTLSEDRSPKHECDYAVGEFVTKAILNDPESVMPRAARGKLSRVNGEFFENLDPYLVLRMLAQNASNLDFNVVWRFADLVAGGWAKADDFRAGPGEADTILVVTEGSTDSEVLKKSLPIVLPHVSDFFSFIDMKNNYPFTGTGSVVQFCRGLARINIQNRILVVLDNDTAGHEALALINELTLPRRMRATVLPDLEECRSVRTLGPAGEQDADINGKAVSIEWFLETALHKKVTPVVRWKGFIDARGTYQGELVDKQAYTKHFFDRIGHPGHGWPKLEYLWRHLLRKCTEPTSL